ncbi:DUF1249 domain-containing protein [Herbaspirillum sp. NPDC087042]|uniref:DUF1249 domain-containing protein n=1 Tax=Herbaspirillum sp. NPDC087042 TaxID=3364004 RepID=UPI0037F2BA53
MSAELLYAEIYRKLLVVIPDLLTIDGAGRSKVKGLKTLNLNVISRSPSRLKISLSRYYKNSLGKDIPDPDVAIAVYPTSHIAEVWEYMNVKGLTSVYSLDGSWVDIFAKRHLNKCLNNWLGDLIAQGHVIKTRIG